MDIKKFLKANRLTNTWLLEQLTRRGYTVEESWLSRIISGERKSDAAAIIRTECESICRKYSDM